MNNVLILLDRLDDWKPYYETKSVLTVSDYLKNKPAVKDQKLVFNLSNDYSYNSEGYYCSLLARTRGQRVIPGVDIINKLETGTGVRMDHTLQNICYQYIQKNNIKDDIWYLRLFFGKCKEKGLERIARFLFENYPCPLLEIGFNTHQSNQIESINYLPLNKLNDEEQDFFADTLDKFS
ncbi:MAG: RimK-like ATPgrasp N-terminal domain-containing protein, partial [Bacteroidaceae bacterium]|nr:RimK-like ATPgrasp N-terminal domain-containing protein [Bacteroidaceae bacterium]